jgi:Zn-dependent membrane protease YugP
MIFIILGVVILFALIFGPQLWIQRVMARHAGERADYPGSGGELARHLLDEAGLDSVKVEIVETGDHYSPVDKAVRLTKANHDGRSVTAVAVAAHEVGHALQDAEGYAPLRIRQTYIGYAVVIERIASVVLLASPLIFALTRSPHLMAFQVIAGLSVLASTIVLHIVTLPTEFDASFKRALPILAHFIRREDLKDAREVLGAAALTYVASAFASLVNLARWIRVLRF